MTAPFRTPRGERLARLAAYAVGVLALLLLAVHGLLNSDAVAGAVRARAQEELERRLGPTQVGPNVAISLSGSARLGPLAVLDDEGASVIEIDEVRIRPSYLALLGGHVRPARVSLGKVRVHAGREGQALVALAKRLAHREGPKGAKEKPRAAEGQPLLTVDALWIDLPGEAGPSLFGPVAGRLKLEREGARRRLDARLEVGSEGSLRATGSMEDGAGELELKMEAIPLTPLAAPLSARTGVALQGGAVFGKVKLAMEAGGKLAAEVDGALRGLTVQSERIADGPVGPLDVGLVGKVKADRARAEVALEDAVVKVGPEGSLEVPVELSAGLLPEPHFAADVRVGPVALSRIVKALPEALAPGDGAPHVDGPVRAELRVSGPVRKPAEWTMDVKLDTSQLKAVARQASFPLREGFLYRPQEPHGPEREIWVGEKNPHFVPLAQLPPIVALAVTTSEDAGFYAHNGFDFDEIRDSFATLADGTRVRGGSTLTQQLVKNLYLSRERTLARKIREALITLQVEAALPKQRILEIYLNIIEWGPDIYGIGEAAEHYFGIDARQLDVKQAVFLTTLIPSPIRYHGYFSRNTITESEERRMGDLLAKLLVRGVVSEAEYEAALREPVVFRQVAKGP